MICTCTLTRIKTYYTFSMNIQLRIEEKREEIQSLQELKNFTGVLADQLELLEQKLDTMANGAESVALILSNWQNVVNSISLASLGLRKYSSGDYDSKTPLPETLVRINLDKDENPTA